MCVESAVTVMPSIAVIGHFRDDRKDKTVMAMKGNVAVIPCEPPKGEPIAVHFTMNNTTIQQSAGENDQSLQSLLAL